MAGGQAQIAAVYPAVAVSQVVVKVGQEIPGEKVGETAAKIQDVSAILGYSFTEPGEGEAKIRLWDGESNIGRYICTVTLAKGATSARDIFSAPYLYNGAIYLEVVSGKVEGTVIYA